MGVIVTGLNNLLASLNNKAERASRGARDALEEGAEMIKDRAVEYAPVDLENLEKSIKVKKTIDTLMHRRVGFDVYVDEEMLAPGDRGRGGRHKKVGDYADAMHELSGVAGGYNLGKKSQDKMRDTGKLVGAKYLERAYLELEEEVKAKAEAGVSVGVGH